ncbi:MAG: hypothetical protein OES13_07445 [Acidimicrobiia bacterium]|nr:hypothetical protein [Acidimicrobiia bacterium]
MNQRPLVVGKRRSGADRVQHGLPVLALADDRAGAHQALYLALGTPDAADGETTGDVESV